MQAWFITPLIMVLMWRIISAVCKDGVQRFLSTLLTVSIQTIVSVWRIEKERVLHFE